MSPRRPSPADSAEAERDARVAEARQRRARIDSALGQAHVPNHIPRRERLLNVGLSLALLALALWGVIHDDLYIPGKRGGGLHLHGLPRWVMTAALLCTVVNLMAVVVDHHDRRPNEASYRRVAAVTQGLAWALFFLALALQFIRGG